MKRRERLNLIQEIVSKQSISTQRELQRVLELAGVNTSQTCLSHDLHELKIKKKRKDGKFFYSCLTELEIYIYHFVLKVSFSDVLVVISTQLGEADILAEAFDKEKRPEILGTLAGADTLLLICANQKVAKVLMQEIEKGMYVKNPK